MSAEKLLKHVDEYQNWNKGEIMDFRSKYDIKNNPNSTPKTHTIEEIYLPKLMNKQEAIKFLFPNIVPKSISFAVTDLNGHYGSTSRRYVMFLDDKQYFIDLAFESKEKE